MLSKAMRMRKTMISKTMRVRKTIISKTMRMRKTMIRNYIHSKVTSITIMFLGNYKTYIVEEVPWYSLLENSKPTTFLKDPKDKRCLVKPVFDLMYYSDY